METNSKYAHWSKIGEKFITSTHGCSRCHGDGHENLVWKPFVHPIEFEDKIGFVATHWANCPTTGDPIMMGGYDKEEEDE